MRVIGGVMRSRVLDAPEGLDTRPTTDRLRETLFNVLTNGAVNRVEGASFLDLYAGSGAVGIEALSRGASFIAFVEQGAAALTVLRKNLDKLGIRTGVAIEKRSVSAYLLRSTMTFDVVYLDPPYDDTEEYTRTLESLGGDRNVLLAANALVIAEHRRKSILQDNYGQLERIRLLQQGDAGLSFYEVRREKESSLSEDS